MATTVGSDAMSGNDGDDGSDVPPHHHHHRCPVPALAGVSEVAALLGVSRQRVDQLRRRPEFPRPVASLAATDVWLVTDITVYGAVRFRRPGRPRRVTS